jgi:antitoxin (DNA-binding transcriptional repressor) of toxin-antitoxin stability system
MDTTINAKTLRSELASVMERVKKGERFTVLYRSHPVCRLVPIDGNQPPPGQLQEESLYRASAVGTSSDGLSAADHDRALYKSNRSK